MGHKIVSVMGLSMSQITNGLDYKQEEWLKLEFARNGPFAYLPNFNKMPQNSKTHNLLILLSFGTNEHNFGRY